MSELPDSSADRFLVCGLGSLGQYCVHSLQRFAEGGWKVHVQAIELSPPTAWEVENLPDLLAGEVIRGDCRLDEMLRRGGVESCRALLAVTSDEHINIQTAMAARRLNPRIRLVVRCTKHNLNKLLQEQLGNYVALDATELPASAFAMAALQSDILGQFEIEGRGFRVRWRRVTEETTDLIGRDAIDLQRGSLRLIRCEPATSGPPRPPLPGQVVGAHRAFYQWPGDHRIGEGDRIWTIERLALNPTPTARARSPHRRQTRPGMSTRFKRWLAGIRGDRTWGGWLRETVWERTGGRIILIGVILAGICGSTATVMLKTQVPGMTWHKAGLCAVMLLMGSFSDLFGGLRDETVIPDWVEWVSLLISAVSVLYVVGALGVVADHILNSRLEFLRRSPELPERDHVIVFGLGRLARRVAALLRQFGQPLVAVAEEAIPDRDRLPYPVVASEGLPDFLRLHAETARSLVVLSEDEMLNLEVALAAQTELGTQPFGLVVRAFDQQFSRNLVQLLPSARVLVAYELAGEAFAAAGYGENILGLFRLEQHTILVTEYMVEASDALDGRLLADIAYGYGVVPVVLRRKSARAPTEEPVIFPADDIRIEPGDRLVVLASINGLRRIEHRELARPTPWRLRAQPPLRQEFLHSAGPAIARITGCPLDRAVLFMESLPGSLDLSLYPAQAARLRRELERQFEILLEPLTEMERV